MLTMNDMNEKWLNIDEIMMIINKQQHDSFEGQIIKYNPIMVNTLVFLLKDENIFEIEKST